MINLVWIFGAVITVLGIVSVIKPIWMKNVIAFMSHHKRFYLAGLIRIIVGIIFLLFAMQTRWPTVIIIFAILFLLGGIIVLVLPAAKTLAIIQWWMNKPFWLYRVWGVLAALIGGLIMYAGVPAATV